MNRLSVNQQLPSVMAGNARYFRAPTVAEVMNHHTCWPAGPFSAVNVDVPQRVPVWQYADPDDRARAARSQA